MTSEVEKENDAVKVNNSTHRRSIAGPMQKLFKRLSGIPSESRISETPAKPRLSFQSWRRRRTLDRKKSDIINEVKEKDSWTSTGEAFKRPLQASNSSINRTREYKRGPLRAAPLAEAEEVVFPEAKRPKLINSAAKRLSAISYRPKRVSKRQRKTLATEIKSPTKQRPRMRIGNSFELNGSLSNHSVNSSDLPSPNERLKNRLSISDIENGVDPIKRRESAIEPRELPFEITATTLNDSFVSAERTPARIRQAGKTLFNSDPHLGIEYLIQQNVVNRDPSEIAAFLFERGLSRQAIGEYFGKLSDPLANSVTEAFIRRLNLHNVELDVALRRLLQQLHPDGESQKIEFLLCALKNCYIEQNSEKVAREFHDPETIGVLAYSIMLLHTTFYNQNAKKHGKSMTKIEFINNNRGIDGGKDISMPLLEGIYDRVTEQEFKTLPDPTDHLRRVDDLFTGPFKPERFVQRQRRFVAWFFGLEVFDFTAKKFIVQRPSAQLRCLFIFNDLLVVTKPVGMIRNNAVDEMLYGGSHRIRSFDRISNRVGSPTPAPVELYVDRPAVQRYNVGAQDARNHRVYSTDVPMNGPFLVRNIVPLENIAILHFSGQSYKYGVQLYDGDNALININFPTGQAKKKFIEYLHESIWEFCEVKKFIDVNKSAPITPNVPTPSSTSVARNEFF